MEQGLSIQCYVSMSSIKPRVTTAVFLSLLPTVFLHNSHLSVSGFSAGAFEIEMVAASL